MFSDTNKLALMALVTGALLLVPLIAMQFTDEVNWKLGDFVVAAALLLAAQATYHLVASNVELPWQRATMAAALGVLLLAVWTQLAVGVL